MAEKSDGRDTSAGRPRSEELARRSTSPEDPEGQHDPPVRKEADHTDVRAIFRQWDPTGRGMIRKDELLSTFSGLGLHMGERELSLMLEAADMSGDESVHCGKFLRWLFAPASSSENGHQANVSSQDVQTELKTSVPGLGSKVEAEADETEIENCGDILQAAKEGNVGAVRRLLQVDPQSLEQVDEDGDGPLHFAAESGHLEVVVALLAAGASVEAKNHNGYEPLHFAAESGHLEVVEALLAAGASVEAKGINGYKPLHFAAESGHLEVVVAPLAAGASVEAKGINGYEPLHFAAKSGHLEVVVALLAAGASVEAKGSNGNGPLAIAAWEGHPEVVVALLAAGPSVEAKNNIGRTPLHHAAGNGHAAVVEQLLAAGAAVDAVDNQGRTPLHWAADKGRTAVVEQLLAAGAAVDAVDNQGYEPLHLAAEGGHLEVVVALLAAGASVDAKDDKGYEPLHLAAEGGHLEVVVALLAAGASVDAKDDKGSTPLHRAAEEGRTAAVERLLAAGAAVDAASSKGSTPLHRAADNGHAAVVEQLLAAGAAVDAVDKGGQTPLHNAADNGHAAVVEQLLAAGAAVDAVNSLGCTPLHGAAIDGHTAVVEQLLAAGAAVDAVDKGGRTPLHGAAIDGHTAVVEQLLAAGAAVDAVSNEGKTPYDIAKMRGHREVMGVLDPVFVALLSGRSCKCSSYHETVQELKEEAEKKLGITIQRLIGVNMEPLNEAKTLEEAGVLPGHTLTAVIAPAAGQGDVSEEKQLPEDEGDLQNPNDFIEFLISANIRLVRAEFLIELDETGTPMPRRQEAEFMHVQSGATALVELGEYKELHLNQTSGHVTIRTAEGPSTVRFRSISHMWEAMEHPDPWGFQVRSIVERYRELPKDSVTWVFVDFMSLYQCKRSAEEDEFFRKGLKRMHWLYSHEIVQVDILTELTPEDKKFEGEILVYNATEDQVKLTPICELRLNNTPYELRGWCQSESEWSRLRMDVLGGCIPTPPDIFRKRMQQMRFTHRNDAEQVLALQEKVFRDKVSRTTHLQLQQLSVDDLECLHDALPHYNRLEYLVVNGNALKGQDAVAMVTSGAADIQMESCSLQDEDADAMAEALMSSAADRLEHLSLTGNRFSDIGTAALRKVMEQRPQLKIRL